MNRTPRTRQPLRAFLGALLATTLLGGPAAQADDVEIYLQPPPDPVPPNVLFILDESGSMSSHDGSRTSRMDDLKSAMRTLLNDSGLDNVNVGILGYTTRSGNNSQLRIRVVNNFQRTRDARSQMLSAVNSLRPRNYTPSVKALEFAADWFADGFNLGQHPVGYAHNDDDGDGNHSSSDLHHYASPVRLWCQPNHMVLLTDGQPNSNDPNRGERYGLTRYRPADPDGSTSCVSNSTTRWQNGRCAAEIAYWGYHTDLRSGDAWPEQQRIITHTIGFHTNTAARNYLVNIARNGGGNYYSASNASDLVSAFAEILQTAIASVPYTYTAPSIPFNPDQAAVSGDWIYVPLFEPANHRFWRGNLKKYRIKYEPVDPADPGGRHHLVLLDRNGQPVLNAALQFQNRQDFWGSAPDGGQPLAGGAASHQRGTRHLYTWLGGSRDLTAAENRIRAGNAAITRALLGVRTNQQRRDLLRWITWDNGAPEHRGVMGAPLHSHPLAVRYPNAPDLVLLTTTEGILHALDADSGQEVWAFMPRELLGTLRLVREDAGSTLPLYGLDGPMTYYESGGHKYVVFGMRRGGRNYYALDITERSRPRFAWRILGGRGDFARLGQTWSRPVFTRLEIEGDPAREVLIFGGGYDPDQDHLTTRRNDDLGNVIYLVDPATGARIKAISADPGADLTVAHMDNAIASDVLPVDINANGITDRLYASDVGGRIIRIDIPDQALATATGQSAMSGGVIADVNAGDGPADFQRFFNTPEVAYYSRGGVTFLALLIASGNVPHPLDDSVQDRFFMIKDENVWHAPPRGIPDEFGNTPPIEYPQVTEADLYDATANLIQDGTADQKKAARRALQRAKGWYIDLDRGEKGYSAAKVFDYAVMFTTYKGERSASSDPCTASATVGEARFYALNMMNGAAIFDMVDDGRKERRDRRRRLRIPGLPPAPTLVFPGNGDGHLSGMVIALAGLEEAARWTDRFHPISWEEVLDE